MASSSMDSTLSAAAPDVDLFATMRTQLANNLKLLSVDEFVRRRKETIAINEDTFKKLTPKAFQLITYHLFQTAEPEECRRRFIGCFPVLDRKQEGEFRQSAYKWLHEISQKETSCHFPRVVPIYFQHFTPEITVCHLYLDFSNYCLKKYIQRMSGSASVAIKPHNEITIDDVKELSEDYRQIKERIIADTEEWRQRMEYFLDDYYKTSDSLKKLQQQKDHLLLAVRRAHGLDGDQNVEQFITDRFERLQSDANAMAATLVSMNQLVAKHWPNYVTAFESTNNKSSFNNTSIDFRQLFDNNCEQNGSKSLSVVAQELINFAQNYDSILEHISDKDVNAFSDSSDEFLAKGRQFCQQLKSMTEQMKAMAATVKETRDKRRAELLATPAIQERRKWFAERIPDFSRLKLRFEPKRRESLGLIPEIIDSKAAHEENGSNGANGGGDDESPVYRSRPSLYDYSFQLMDISTVHYIAPSGGSAADDSRLFSPVENKTRSVFNSSPNSSSSANSFLNIISLVSNNTGTSQVTCNGVIASTANIPITAYDPTGAATTITITSPVSTLFYINGDRLSERTGIVSGGPCDGSVFVGQSIYSADQPNGCADTSGVISATCAYSLWTLTGACTTTCQINLIGAIGSAGYTMSTGVTNNGLVK
ncbi:unnamed protein product [Medioppia subpectinata]|uniref:HAUS augmin-like complex subunit 6 N-terminal domain-containing protein n=1 Tax=Medioppia subpectinata TaxID=1979941 RepID=A0A7R9KNS0_9ACAR|nr:unnamed protein product [Medioppia subpectinata]CAG2106634.1 unnamed protein product [Medioppia subpectinata]